MVIFIRNLYSGSLLYSNQHRLN